MPSILLNMKLWIFAGFGVLVLVTGVQRLQIRTYKAAEAMYEQNVQTLTDHLKNAQVRMLAERNANLVASTVHKREMARSNGRIAALKRALEAAEAEDEKLTMCINYQLPDSILRELPQ